MVTESFGSQPGEEGKTYDEVVSHAPARRGATTQRVLQRHSLSGEAIHQTCHENQQSPYERPRL